MHSAQKQKELLQVAMAQIVCAKILLAYVLVHIVLCLSNIIALLDREKDLSIIMLSLSL